MESEMRVMIEARNLLASERDRDLAAQKLCGFGVNLDQANAIVRGIFKENQRHNRKQSFVKMIGGIGGLALVGALLVFAHRLFYWILIISAISAVWGLAGFIGADGYELDQ